MTHILYIKLDIAVYLSQKAKKGTSSKNPLYSSLDRLISLHSIISLSHPSSFLVGMRLVNSISSNMLIVQCVMWSSYLNIWYILTTARQLHGRM
jgi:hypothetical protein